MQSTIIAQYSSMSAQQLLINLVSIDFAPKLVNTIVFHKFTPKKSMGQNQFNANSLPIIRDHLK